MVYSNHMNRKLDLYAETVGTVFIVYSLVFIISYISGVNSDTMLAGLVFYLLLKINNMESKL